MNDTSPISSKSMLLEIVNILNIQMSLVARTNNGIGERNVIFRLIYLLMDILHMFLRKTIKIIPA